MAVRLGTKVKDRITGLEGIATSRTEYLYGCVHVGVQPEGLKDGKPIETSFFDEQRLEDEPTATSGGPNDHPPARETPPSR